MRLIGIRSGSGPILSVADTFLRRAHGLSLLRPPSVGRSIRLMGGVATAVLVILHPHIRMLNKEPRGYPGGAQARALRTRVGHLHFVAPADSLCSRESVLVPTELIGSTIQVLYVASSRRGRSLLKGVSPDFINMQSSGQYRPPARCRRYCDFCVALPPPPPSPPLPSSRSN